MNSVLISIKPRWVCDILNGNKTIEIRKTAPKCELPIEVYIYCSKGDQELYEAFSVMVDKFPYQLKPKNRHLTSMFLKEGHHLNGKVVGKFILRKVQFVAPIEFNGLLHGDFAELFEKACISVPELYRYTDFRAFYIWYISDLVIFDNPMELSDFYGMPKKIKGFYVSLSKAPQSWQFVELF